MNERRNPKITGEDLQWAEEFMLDGDPYDSVLEAADGCSVEPDGVCPHGHPSPLIVLGSI